MSSTRRSTAPRSRASQLRRHAPVDTTTVNGKVWLAVGLEFGGFTYSFDSTSLVEDFVFSRYARLTIVFCEDKGTHVMVTRRTASPSASQAGADAFGGVDAFGGAGAFTPFEESLPPIVLLASAIDAKSAPSYSVTGGSSMYSGHDFLNIIM